MTPARRGARGPTRPPIGPPEPSGNSKCPPRRRPPRLQAVSQQKVALRPPNARSRPQGRLASRPHDNGPRGTAAILGRSGETHQAQKGPRLNTTAGQAPRRTSMSATPGALQVLPGTAQGSPVSSPAAGSTPRHEGADLAACATDQSPLLQRGDNADFRRPPTVSLLGQLHPGWRNK
ncbi:hypothetical protein NDU88_007676 [Pleurodeles waltl]|uniref:Uncharacterized protein n=1 Tax=Pleurodeles waltl TaxID=8319 RepID=A0AAV7VV33_PLEWA|nr:hypothetical protein NDU88_007676 [Pleurodeles waltl]